MLHRSLRGPAQNLKQVGRKLRQVHGFFDELGQTVFHADSRAQFGRQHRPLPRDVFHRDAEFVQGAKLLMAAGFRAQAHKGGAQHALQVGVRLLAHRSPILRIDSAIKSPPAAANRSASWLMPVAILRRGSASFASRQLK